MKDETKSKHSVSILVSAMAGIRCWLCEQCNSVHCLVSMSGPGILDFRDLNPWEGATKERLQLSWWHHDFRPQNNHEDLREVGVGSEGRNHVREHGMDGGLYLLKSAQLETIAFGGKMPMPLVVIAAGRRKSLQFWDMLPKSSQCGCHGIKTPTGRKRIIFKHLLATQ